MRRRVVLLTGAGTSIGSGFESTEAITDAVARRVRENRVLTHWRAGELYEAIENSLRDLLQRPGIMTFEHVYQAIMDVEVLATTITDRGFDGFRPVVKATHELRSPFSQFSEEEVHVLQGGYHKHLLEYFAELTRSRDSPGAQDEAIGRLRRGGCLQSFTLNYDDLICRSIEGAETGFQPGPEPRTFAHERILGAVTRGSNVHCHLHGALRWGRPYGKEHRERRLDVFGIHEFDTVDAGVRFATSLPSGHLTQSGRQIPSGTVITGLTKTDAVFRQPFLSYLLAFFTALERCTDLVIAGYSFSDYHVNEGIRALRERRHDVRTYLVDRHQTGLPDMYFDMAECTPAKIKTLRLWTQNVELDRVRPMKNNEGWHLVPGAEVRDKKNAPMALWLGGWDSFCRSVAAHGLPDLPGIPRRSFLGRACSWIGL